MVHNWLNMELLVDLKSLFGLHVHSCTHGLRTRNPPPPPTIPPHLGSYTRALLVSQDSRQLFVTPCGTIIIMIKNRYLIVLAAVVGREQSTAVLLGQVGNGLNKCD
jgi:hypothetical protein